MLSTVGKYLCPLLLTRRKQPFAICLFVTHPHLGTLLLLGRSSADGRNSPIGHDQHRARRAALNHFFSMASVRRLEPVIAERVNALMQRLQGFKDVKGDVGVIKANYAFAAFTNGKHRPFLRV